MQATQRARGRGGNDTEEIHAAHSVFKQALKYLVLCIVALSAT